MSAASLGEAPVPKNMGALKCWCQLPSAPRARRSGLERRRARHGRVGRRSSKHVSRRLGAPQHKGSLFLRYNELCPSMPAASLGEAPVPKSMSALKCWCQLPSAPRARRSGLERRRARHGHVGRRSPRKSPDPVSYCFRVTTGERQRALVVPSAPRARRSAERRRARHGCAGRRDPRQSPDPVSHCARMTTSERQ